MADNISDSLDRMKDSFLFAAAESGSLHDCEALIDIGASMEWKSIDCAGDSALHAACRRGHTEVVAYLLKKGANVNALGADNYTPLHICSKRNDTRTLEILMQSKPNTELKTKDGLTAHDLALNTSNKDDNFHRTENKRTPSDSKQASSTTAQAKRASSSSSSSSSQSQSPLRIAESKEVNINNKNSTSTVTASNNSPHRQRKEITDDTKEIATSSGTPKKENSGYSLVGPNMIPEHNETALTLRKLLETEQRERRSAESQAEMMRTQIDMMREVIHELKSEIEIVRDHAQNYEVERNQYEKEASKYKTDNINRANIEECEVLEKELRSTLETIESRKANLIAEKARIDNMDDRRLCVICCEKEKSIVLLPCRHMCLCEDCSEHDDLLQCPLCRRQIAHKFSVFA